MKRMNVHLNQIRNEIAEYFSAGSNYDHLGFTESDLIYAYMLGQHMASVTGMEDATHDFEEMLDLIQNNKDNGIEY